MATNVSSSESGKRDRRNQRVGGAAKEDEDDHDHENEGDVERGLAHR